MSLADRLNELGCKPRCERGQVTLTHDPAQAEVVAELDIDGYLDSHPEGAGRGGYVPYVFSEGESAFYCDIEGVWFKC
jgi:hypothetical protein